jgi:hypothetical protein
VDWELKLVDSELVRTICICVRQVNWFIIDICNKIGGWEFIVSTVCVCVRQ